MQHLSSLELMKRAVRCQVCPHCHRRPKGSESLGLTEARSCEPTCAIFQFLPRLSAIAARHPNVPGEYENAIKSWICADCHLSKSAGEYCAERLACTCPLATYGNKVIELVEGLLAVR